MARLRALTTEALAALEMLREKVVGLADVEESATYGNPAFKIKGRPFAILDRYRGSDCLWLLIDKTVRNALAEKPGWFASPYDPRKVAMCCAISEIRWRSIGPLMRRAYDLAQR